MKNGVRVTNRVQRHYVPCGKCNYCLATKRADWSLRLSKELKTALSAKFLTFTYSDENLPRNDCGFTTFNKKHVQDFMKRLRKETAKVSKVSLRYYLVAEYGEHTFRPHYHAIMFNLPVTVIPKLPEIWSLGHIHIGDVSDASINYVTKYVINRTSDMDGRDPPWSLMSKRPGIGAPYLTDAMKQWHKSDLKNYTVHNGTKRKLPRYFKDKIFSDSERKRMADKSLLLQDVEYVDEILRLERLHECPENYYDERLAYAHGTLYDKLNQNDKF